MHGDVEEFINERKSQLSAIVEDEVVYTIGVIPLSVKTAIVDINEAHLPVEWEKTGLKKAERLIGYTFAGLSGV
jgi:hypothetical protein